MNRMSQLVKRYWMPLLMEIHPDFFAADIEAYRLRNQTSLQHLSRLVAPLRDASAVGSAAGNDQSSTTTITTNNAASIAALLRNEASRSALLESTKIPLVFFSKTKRQEHRFDGIAVDRRHLAIPSATSSSPFLAEGMHPLSVAWMIRFLEVCTGVLEERHWRKEDGLLDQLEEYRRQWADGVPERMASAADRQRRRTATDRGIREEFERALRQDSALHQQQEEHRRSKDPHARMEEMLAFYRQRPDDRCFFFSDHLSETERVEAMLCLWEQLPSLDYGRWSHLPVIVGDEFRRGAPGFLQIPARFQTHEFQQYLNKHLKAIEQEYRQQFSP